MDSSRYMTFLSQDGLTLPDYSYYLKDDIETNKNYLALQSAIKREWMLIEPDAENLESRANAIASLEKKLAENFVSHAEQRDAYKMYNKFTIEKLHTMAKFFPWTEFFTSLFGEKKINEVVIVHK